MKVEHQNSFLSFLAPSGKVAFTFGLPQLRFSISKKSSSSKPSLEWREASSEISVKFPDSLSFPSTLHFGLSASIPLELAQNLYYGMDEDEDDLKSKKSKGFGVWTFDNFSLCIYVSNYSSLCQASLYMDRLFRSRNHFPSYYSEETLISALYLLFQMINIPPTSMFLLRVEQSLPMTGKLPLTKLYGVWKHLLLLMYPTVY